MQLYMITPPPPPPPPSPSPSTLTTTTNRFFAASARTNPLAHTLRLLPLLPSPDTVTYNTAISACLHHLSPSSALHLFVQMLHLPSPLSPDSITLRSVLRACAQSRNRSLPPQLHSYFLKLQPLFTPTETTIIYTCLLNTYINLGDCGTAHHLFVRIPHKDVVAYTSMLKGLNDAGEYEEALEVFGDMACVEGLAVNEHAYSSALHACAGVSGLFAGRQIHARVVKTELESDAFVGTGLVDLYAKCGEVESARMAFAEISRPNVVSCNALLAGSLDGDDGMRLFSWMWLSGLGPDNVTFASVLRACKSVLSVGSVRELHGLLVRVTEVELDVFLSCALFEAYLDLGCFREAGCVYGRMKEKDDASFNLAIQAYLRNGHEADAVELFYEALHMGKEMREVTLTSLLMKFRGLDPGKQLHALIVKFGRLDALSASFIRMYTEYHQMDEVSRLFDHIPFPDLISWTNLLSNFSRCGENEGALNLYVKMISEGSAYPPNHYTFSAILKSCAHLAAAIEGKQIHAQIIKSHLNSTKSDPFVVSALLYMYSKCGYIEEARRLFNDMQERDLVSWNAMITSLAHHGHAEEAIETFQELLNQKDLEPNHISFVGVLTACSHCGMVETGYQYFKSIREPVIDHYACVIDLFSRAGHLKKALDLVEEMPFEPNEIIWSSLLASSSKYGNVSVGEYSAKKLLELDPTDPGTYIALSNIYAGAGRWDDMKHTRELMKSQADEKSSGFSLLTVNRQKYSSLTDGRSICMPN